MEGNLRKFASLAFAAALLATLSCRREIETRRDVEPGGVHFLALPASAERVSYWNDGNNRMAVFTIQERQFRDAFSTEPLKEIVNPVGYVKDRFGDPRNPPWPDFDAFAEHGLVYEKTEQNGGGVRLIYDRDRKIGFVHYVRW